MKSLTTLFSLCVLGVLCLAAAPAAMADETAPGCNNDARNQYLVCKASCREAFLVDHDTCRNIDHDCADACRAGREACVAQPFASLETCASNCNDTLAGAKDDCRGQFGEGTPERDVCIDTAQVASFQCRDTCREGVREALRQCRVTFQACVDACPAAPHQ